MTLQFPDTEIPSWARELPNGGEGGIRAFQIDGSGLDVKNYMMYKLTLPMGSAPSVRGSVRFKSSLEAFNPAFEGFAARFRGYDANGSEAWDSRPEEKGRRAWRDDKTDDWTDAVFVEPVPTDKGIVEITFEILVKAQSGLLTVCKPECRYHYSTKTVLDLTGESEWQSRFGDFSSEIIDDGLAGADNGTLIRWVAFARTEPVEIEKGRLAKAFVRGSFLGTCIERADALPLTLRNIEGSSMGVMFKLRIKETGQYDYITPVDAPTSYDGRHHRYITNSISFQAREDYDQVEVLPYLQPAPADEDNGWTAYVIGGVLTDGAQFIGIKDLEAEMVVSDYLEPTQ